MNQEPEKKRRLPRALGVAIALCLCVVLSGLLVASMMRSPSFPLFPIASVSITALLFGFWIVVRRINSWSNLRQAMLALAGLATLIAVFYTVENWRGKRSWDNCKREFEAEGMSLDWNTLIPPPVPDDQNVFKAPRMQEWFVGRLGKGGSSELSKRLNPGGFHGEHDFIAELVIVTPGISAAPEAAEITLDYQAPFLTLASSRRQSAASTAQAPVLPLVEVNDTLQNAIRTLAHQANIDYSLDPILNSMVLDPTTGRPPLLKAPVSLRWENITAREALLALLNKYGLLLMENPDGHTRITPKDPMRGIVIVDDSVKTQLARIAESAAAVNTNNPSARSLKSCRGNFPLVADPLIPIKPVRIVVQARKMPSREEVAKFFSPTDAFRFLAQSSGNNSFRVWLRSVGTVPQNAAEYLAWSDRCEPDFDVIREALKRPYARMPGDYSQPFTSPIPDFISIRTVVQMLADRAKCYLLTGHPEEALRQVTLINDLRRLLEGKPTGKPMTLVAAMINVTVAGLYADTVADGFRLQAWREPQLVALQQQLQQIDLPPPVMTAMQHGLISNCRQLETFGLGRFMTMLNEPTEPKKTAREEKLTELKRRGYDLLPLGWVYQNMASNARARQPIDKSFDPVRNVFVPRVSNEFTREIEKLQTHRSPYDFTLLLGIPSYSRALQTTGRNQSLVNQALIVCALERYRMANGRYPDFLDALAPRYLGKIPHDIIGGEPLKYRRAIGEPGSGTNESFTLYSIGWNETDDGGHQVLDNFGAQSLDKGDWAWR